PWPRATAPCGLVAPAKGLATGGRPCRRPLPRTITAVGALAVSDHPCKWPGRGWLPPSSPPSLQIVARTQRIVLRNSVSSHVVKKPIYYTNNLGSDTTVGKSQREHHMCTRRSKQNQFPMSIKIVM
ncbi:hypothetical protein BHM03_00054189, partial [Ensete ventricosum]